MEQTMQIFYTRSWPVLLQLFLRVVELCSRGREDGAHCQLKAYLLSPPSGLWVAVYPSVNSTVAAGTDC